MTRPAKRVAPAPPILFRGYWPSVEVLKAEERERAEASLPFPAEAIAKRRGELWACRAFPPHEPCTCWPAGMPTVDDAVRDLALEQLGVKIKSG